MCAKPDDWWPLDSTRCEKDINGKNTGYLLRKEINREGCSDSAYAVRWTKSLQCDSCKKPTSWQLAVGDSCQKIGGVNTGIRLKAYQNIEPCSDSAGMIKWVQYGAACDSCKKDQDWQPIDSFECIKVGGDTTGYRKQMERNMEFCSVDGGAYRWKDFVLNCDSCPAPPKWRPTGVVRCQTTGGGGSTLLKSTNNASLLVSNYTGFQERQEVDSSACGGFAVRWVQIGYNPTVCPPPACNESNCNGPDKKCIDDTCRTGTKIYVCPREAGGQWYCRYVYVWAPGDSSIVYEEPTPQPIGIGCPIQIHCSSEPSSASINKQQAEIIDAINNREYTGSIKSNANTDRFYRSVLPDKLYVQYQQKRTQTGQRK
jgi:hypothetical protein